MRGGGADIGMLFVVNNNRLSELHQHRRPGLCLFRVQQRQNRTRRHGWADCPYRGALWRAGQWFQVGDEAEWRAGARRKARLSVR